MKLILAAAAAAFAMPAIAQDTTQTTTTTTTTAPMSGPMVQQLPAEQTADTGTYPMCTRTVVDHCMERSNHRGERLHTTPRPPGS